MPTPWAVNPGSHQVRVVLEDHEDFSSNVSVIGAASRTVEVSLSPTGGTMEPGTGPVGPGPDPGPEPEPAGDGISTAWFAITTSLALSLAIGGMVTGVMANNREEDFGVQYDLCRGGNDQVALDACEQGRDLASQGESLATATNVLLASAGVFAITAIVLAFFTDWGSGEEEASTVSLGLTPLVGSSPSRTSGFLLDAAFRF